MLEVIQPIPIGGSQAIPDQPSTDAAKVPVAGLLSSWVRLASCMFTLFNPPSKAFSSTVANFIRSVCVWPFFWDSMSQCSSILLKQVLYCNCLSSDEGQAWDSTHLLLQLFLHCAGIAQF